MRVLHVMEATIGGTRRHITEVARGQMSLGIEVHLAVSAERQPSFRGDLERLADEGVGILELPMVREVSPRLDAQHARRLVRHLRDLRPDVVHGHSSKGGALGRWASLRAGVGRRVYSPHTLAFTFQNYFSAPKRRLFRAVEAYLGRRTDRMIAVSEEEGRAVRSAGICDPGIVRVVPNGIDIAPYGDVSPVPRADLGVPESAPLAAVVGLVYRAKGQDLALEALGQPGCEDLHLILAGEGEEREAYQAHARRLGVADRAHFLGWRDDVPALLATADFLLLPSRWEGLPYIVLEALASGLPVVASRVDGVGGAVAEGESGFTVPVGDARALGAACARMLAAGPDARREMGRAGRARVEQRFTLEAMVRGHAAVYGELV